MDAFWACSDCGARNAQPGNCATCGEGPLLDARRAEVRDELWKSEELAIRKRNGRLLPLVILVVGFVVLGGMWVATPTLLLGLIFSPVGAIMLAGGLALTSFVLWKVVCSVFPARRRFEWLADAAR